MIEKDEFCECIRQNENAMYSLAYSIVRNDADAAEVLSESVYRAYKNLESIKNPKAFKTWILRIVHNTAVELIRRNSKTVLTYEIPPTPDNECFESSFDLRNAVESLKQPYRTVVILFYYENLSISKIAQITDSNSVAVKKQLSRARNMLKESLKEDFN